MKFILLGMVICSEVFAAGGSGHGSPGDLIPSLVNIAILATALIVLLKGKLRNFFVDKSVVISEMMERAESKAKEAQLMMERQRQKIEGASEEIEKLKAETDEQLVKFEADYKKEVDERIANLKADAGSKIEAEKAAMLMDLNSNLLDQVILKTKQKIKADGALKDKATETLIGELR